MLSNKQDESHGKLQVIILESKTPQGGWVRLEGATRITSEEEFRTT